MRKVIRSLIIEQIQQEKLLKEADLASMTDVFQQLWNFASVGIITYQIVKKIYNSYKTGQLTKEEVQDLVSGLSIDYFKNREYEDLSEDDYEDETIPYDMNPSKKDISHGFDFDNTFAKNIESDTKPNIQKEKDLSDLDRKTLKLPSRNDFDQSDISTEFDFDFDSDDETTDHKLEDTLPIMRR